MADAALEPSVSGAEQEPGRRETRLPRGATTGLKRGRSTSICRLAGAAAGRLGNRHRCMVTIEGRHPRTKRAIAEGCNQRPASGVDDTRAAAGAPYVVVRNFQSRHPNSLHLVGGAGIRPPPGIFRTSCHQPVRAEQSHGSHTG